MVGGRAEPWRIPLSVVAAAYQTITYYAQPRHVPLLEGIQKRSFGSDLFLGLNVTSPSPRLGTSDRLLVPDICTHNPPPPKCGTVSVAFLLFNFSFQCSRPRPSRSLLSLRNKQSDFLCGSYVADGEGSLNHWILSLSHFRDPEEYLDTSTIRQLRFKPPYPSGLCPPWTP